MKIDTARTFWTTPIGIPNCPFYFSAANFASAALGINLPHCRCYCKSPRIAYDGKKSATLTGIVGKSRYIINKFTFDADKNGRVIKAFGN